MDYIIYLQTRNLCIISKIQVPGFFILFIKTLLINLRIDIEIIKLRNKSRDWRKKVCYMTILNFLKNIRFGGLYR